MSAFSTSTTATSSGTFAWSGTAAPATWSATDVGVFDFLEAFAESLEDDSADTSGSPYWEPYGTAGDPISPAGHTCDSMPSAAWVLTWFDALGLRASVYARYDDDTYPLGSGEEGGLPGRLGALWDEIQGAWGPAVAVSNSSAWSSTPTSGPTSVAVSVLDSQVSEQVIQELLPPLGIFTVRQQLALGETGGEEAGDEDGLSIELDIPLLDPYTTPLVRVLRRFRTTSDQALAFADRSGTSAVNAYTADAFYAFNQKLRQQVGLGSESDFQLPAPAFEPADQGDRSYNPMIGVIDEDGPAWRALWGRGGAVGLASLLLLPLRSGPKVMALPLNWSVSNQAEFIGPIAVAWQEYVELAGDDLDAILASLAVDGIALPTELLDALEQVAASDQQLLALPPDLAEELATMLEEMVGGASDPMAGVGDSVQAGVSKTSNWLLVGGALSGRWLVFAAGLLVKLVGNKFARVLEAAERGVADMMQSFYEALSALLTPGAAPNDIVHAVFMAIREALGWLEDVVEEVGTRRLTELYEDIADELEDLEETVIAGVDAEAFLRVSLGMAGRLYQAELEDAASGPDSALDLLSSGPHGALNAALLLEVHQATTPVWMLHESFFDWDFDDFEAYPWYFHETRVDGVDLSAWVEKVSPLWQLIRAIDTAAALLEAGLQAESTLLAISSLPTGADSMGQLLRQPLAAVGWGSIHEIIPDTSLPRLASALWRQAMIDRLLLDLKSAGVDLECVYEVIPWMDSPDKREQLVALLGPLDGDLGRRRYEEGWVGVLGQYDSTEGMWLYYATLDEAWADFPCDQHAAWRSALATLLDRTGLADIQALIDATIDGEGTPPDEPEIVDESDMVSPFSEVGDILDAAAGIYTWEALVWVEEGSVRPVYEGMAADLAEVLVGPTCRAEELALVRVFETVPATTATSWSWASTARWTGLDLR